MEEEKDLIVEEKQEVPQKPVTRIGITKKDKKEDKGHRKTAKLSRKKNRAIANKKRRKTGSNKRR